MALNLSRNTKMWFTTNVNPNTGEFPDQTTGYNAFSSANTYEIQIQDGYTFTQGTEQQTITLNEAGATPVRGQRSFNTSLNPVDFSFSTYIRPVIGSTFVAPIERVLWNALAADKACTHTGSTNVAVTTTAVTRATTLTNVVTIASAASFTAQNMGAIGDSVLLSGSTSDSWNQAGVVTAAQTGAGPYTISAALGKAPLSSAGTAATGTVTAYPGGWAPATAYSYASFAGSNKHQLLKFALVFLVDNQLYAIENCSLNQATIDFGLDAISSIAWSGNGTKLKAMSTLTTANLTAAATTYSASAKYITNKLSTLTLQSNIGGVSGTTYNVPITGGSLTINNNITYVTPANLGEVNQPIGYFTGTRAITGTLNAYLRTGSGLTESGKLLSDILGNLSGAAETKYKLQLEIGGSSNATKVEVEMPGVTITVPTVDVQDVVSTTINFTAQGHNPDHSTGTAGVYDLTQTNDVTIRYYSAA